MPRNCVNFPDVMRQTVPGDRDGQIHKTRHGKEVANYAKDCSILKIKLNLGWPASLFRRGYLSVHETVEKSLTHPGVSFCEENTCLKEL